jgi:hypothetical protein
MRMETKCRAVGWGPGAGPWPWAGWECHRAGWVSLVGGGQSSEGHLEVPSGWWEHRWVRWKWRAGWWEPEKLVRQRCGEGWWEPARMDVEGHRLSAGHREPAGARVVPAERWRKERRAVRPPPSRSRGRFPFSGARSTFVWTEVVVDFRFRSCAHGVLMPYERSKATRRAPVKLPAWEFSSFFTGGFSRGRLRDLERQPTREAPSALCSARIPVIVEFHGKPVL